MAATVPITKISGVPRPKPEYKCTGMILLNSSNECNLDCVYCSEKKHRGGSKKMSFEIAKRCVDLAGSSDNSVSIYWVWADFL